jgi:hypothetical protein
VGGFRPRREFHPLSPVSVGWVSQLRPPEMVGSHSSNCGNKPEKVVIGCTLPITVREPVAAWLATGPRLGLGGLVQRLI